jgi:hypothetical protein
VIASVIPVPTVADAAAGLQVIPAGAEQEIATDPVYVLIGVIAIDPAPVFPGVSATSCVVVVTEKSLLFRVIVSGAEDCAE